MKRKIRDILLGIIGITLTIFVILYISGLEVLISQQTSIPGKTFITKEFGDLGAAKSPYLVCNYLHAFGIKTYIYKYADENKIKGDDACAQIHEIDIEVSEIKKLRKKLPFFQK